MKAVLLTRVSSKEQEEGHSLEAQSRRLRKYCTDKQLTIDKEFTLVESSTRGDRPEFHEMIKYIKKQNEKVALICDKVDRLQRSFKELPIIEELRSNKKMELHFVSEGQVISNESDSAQLLMYNIHVAMANNYTNSISDNVRRSYNKKIQDGEICGSAPLGYLNTTGTDGKKHVIKDPERCHIIKKMFEDYATGLYSLKEIKNMATSLGLRSKKGKELSKSTVESIIKNPFYAGVMVVKGVHYQHKYEHIISQATYQECEKVRVKRKGSYTKNTKIYKSRCRVRHRAFRHCWFV